MDVWLAWLGIALLMLALIIAVATLITMHFHARREAVLRRHYAMDDDDWGWQ